jgi:riboflavin kinase/FMN adenylyltransferase
VEDIISFEEKTALLDSLGVPLCVIIDFSEHFSKIKGRSFLETLNRYLCPAYIALGANFHCGYRRDTGAGEFKEMAEGLGIRAEIIPPVMEGGLPVSSSRIRRALQAGRIEEAALLLGRPPLN